MKEFLKSDAHVLLFIDSDMVFRPLDVTELVHSAHRRQAVVGALYVGRRYPYIPCVRGSEGLEGRLEAALADGGNLVEVHGVGTGLCAIPRIVLMETDFPWFQWPQFEDMNHITDDYYFCDKVRRQTGHKVYVNTGVTVGHIGEKILTYKDWARAREEPDALAVLDLKNRQAEAAFEELAK